MKRKTEATTAKMLSLENSLWKFLEKQAADNGAKNAQQFIAATMRKLKAETQSQQTAHS
jgi:hypothetical protein